MNGPSAIHMQTLGIQMKAIKFVGYGGEGLLLWVSLSFFGLYPWAIALKAMALKLGKALGSSPSPYTFF